MPRGPTDYGLSGCGRSDPPYGGILAIKVLALVTTSYVATQWVLGYRNIRNVRELLPWERFGITLLLIVLSLVLGIVWNGLLTQSCGNTSISADVFLNVQRLSTPLITFDYMSQALYLSVLMISIHDRVLKLANKNPARFFHPFHTILVINLSLWMLVPIGIFAFAFYNNAPQNYLRNVRLANIVWAGVDTGFFISACYIMGLLFYWFRRVSYAQIDIQRLSLITFFLCSGLFTQMIVSFTAFNDFFFEDFSTVKIIAPAVIETICQMSALWFTLLFAASPVFDSSHSPTSSFSKGFDDERDPVSVFEHRVNITTPVDGSGTFDPGPPPPIPPPPMEQVSEAPPYRMSRPAELDGLTRLEMSGDPAQRYELDTKRKSGKRLSGKSDRRSRRTLHELPA